MNAITEKFQETVAAEEKKNSGDASFQELQYLIDEMRKLGVDKKPDYTLPLADTIGKGYYSILNRQQERR